MNYLIVFAIAILLILYLKKDTEEWNMSDQISKCYDPISLITQYRWAGFKSGLSVEKTLKRAMQIGLISRAEYLIQKRAVTDFSGTIVLDGLWFKNNIEQISFRHDPLGKLSEIKFIYTKDTSIFQLSVEKLYQEKIKILDNKVFAWKQYVGIAHNDKVQLTVFLTKK